MPEPRLSRASEAETRLPSPPAPRRRNLMAIAVAAFVLGAVAATVYYLSQPEVLVANLVFGLLLGCVFAVIAHGLNLIWGVAKVVNVAHGEFIMLGAYGAYFLNLYFGINPLLSAPVDAAIGLAVGAGFYFGFLHRELRGKESIGLQSEMVTLVATFGLALFITNLALWAWTGNFVGIPWSPGSIRLGFLQLP